MSDFIAKRQAQLTTHLQNFMANLAEWIIEDDLKPVQAHAIVTNYCINILFHFMEKAHDLRGLEGMQYLKDTFDSVIEIYKKEYPEREKN